MRGGRTLAPKVCYDRKNESVKKSRGLSENWNCYCRAVECQVLVTVAPLLVVVVLVPFRLLGQRIRIGVFPFPFPGFPGFSELLWTVFECVTTDPSAWKVGKVDNRAGIMTRTKREQTNHFLALCNRIYSNPPLCTLGFRRYALLHI